MRRFFYADSLAAAWMAKHYGMRFQALYHNEYKNRDYDTVDEILNQAPTVNLTIHPDSLPLLETQVGDLINWGDMGTRYSEVSDRPAGLMDAKRLMKKFSGKIIQRKGIPFMWPESEEV